MGAGRLLDLLRCLNSFLEMILPGAAVELRPFPITEDRKDRELQQAHFTRVWNTQYMVTKKLAKMCITRHKHDENIL
jgi:hypothetical protein